MLHNARIPLLSYIGAKIRRALMQSILPHVPEFKVMTSIWMLFGQFFLKVSKHHQQTWQPSTG